MSSSSKSSRTGHESSRSSDGSRGKHTHASKHPTHSPVGCDDDVAIPFHRLDSPDPCDDPQQKPNTISFKATLSSAFVAAPVQLTESSSLSCATSTTDSLDHTESPSWNHLPSSKRPGSTRPKSSHERDGDPNVLFESFVSQRGTKDTEWGGGNNAGTSPRPRPNSANSIVNVMKIVTTHTAEATQLIQKHFNICVSGNENAEHEDLRIPFRSMKFSGKASPIHTVEPVITHDSIEHPFQEIPFQHSSGSAFGRVGSLCSLQSISGPHSTDFDPNMSVSRLRSSRGGPSLFLSSSASDVSSSCSGASSSVKDLIASIPTSSNLSSISARAQLSIKNKRRQRRERDSKFRSSLEAVPSSPLTSKIVPLTEHAGFSEDPQPSIVPLEKEEYPDPNKLHDVEPFQSVHSSAHPDILHLSECYDVADPSNISSIPVYYKLEDDDQDMPTRSQSGRNQPKKKATATTPRRQEAIVMPLPSNHSPNSMDGSQSPITIKSFNTSVQSMNSYLSVGSSVIAADREVMELNRSKLRQSKIMDVDGSMSIHSSDSASTQAYGALVGGSLPREGASLRVDQFFNEGRVNHESSGDSIANKSSSSDESPGFVSIRSHGISSNHSLTRREDYYSADVVSYSNLRSLEDKHVAITECLEKKSRSRPNLPKVEAISISDVHMASPSTCSHSLGVSGEKDVVLGNPVSPPSRFFDSHPSDYLHSGTSKPSVVRRYSTIPADPSLREKIDFFSRNASCDVSPIPVNGKSRLSLPNSSKAVSAAKVIVHPSSTDTVSDSCAKISPDK